MYIVLMCALAVGLMIFIAFIWKREKMKNAAICEIPKILGDGKLSAVEIKQKLYSTGVNVSTDTLYYVLEILEESKSIDCVVVPLSNGLNIISHGEYKCRRDSFDDYSSTTIVKRSSAVKG